MTLLETALTKLIRANCLEVSAGSVGKLSLQRTGGTRSLKKSATYQEEEAEEEADTDGHQDCGVMS